MWKMKSKTYVFVGCIIIIILCSILLQPISYSNLSNLNSSIQYEPQELSAIDNNDIIHSIFDTKIQDYSSLGYFPQAYDPSLQATYYGLYILKSIGKLDQINQTDILNYIMSCYTPSTNRFMDTLAYRYLDTDFSKTYFPLSSVLEVNCYAILALDLLESLYLIDTLEMITFIWSCYNNVSGGFIGQSYYPSIETNFKIPTADNTFFAVSTLDLLMDDWLGYSTQKETIIQFINDLQNPRSPSWDAGGFRNDDDVYFDSINPLFEPNLLTSYYCIKTLEVFGVEGSISIIDFHQFLDYLYDPIYHYFRISEWDYMFNYTNIMATALGVELSDITLFTGIDRNEVLTFILENRNSLGNWDQSTTVGFHELIDTFQIIRSLNNIGELSQLSLEEKNTIGNATFLYYQNGGYSHLSEDYTSMSLMNIIVSSFTLFDRLSDLDIHQLYTRIKNSYNDYSYFSISRYFHGYLLSDTKVYWFRSHPIEYYSSGHKTYVDEISIMNSHASTYFALNSLQKLFKLDDFGALFNLNDLLSDIVATQFLNDSYYGNYGAFSSHIISGDPEYINNLIYFEYTYYAIKCLEILSNHLSLNLTSTGFDMDALYTHIDRNIIETLTTLYFTPRSCSSVETILQNTYYMIYILKALNLYDKNTGKIRNYVLENLDYTNIKNVYYCYKISEILELGIEFDCYLTQNLVNSVYCEKRGEFYLSSDKKLIEQDAFLWISEMARNSPIVIDAYYSNEVELGGVNHIEVSLNNLILRDFSSYITFKFESDQLGTYIFDKLEGNTYVTDIPIPLDLEYCPTIEGTLFAYEGVQRKAETPIKFGTTYSLQYDFTTEQTSSEIIFEVNGSILASNTKLPLTTGRVYANIYKDTIFYTKRDFTRVDYNKTSSFILEYMPTEEGAYYVEVYLTDQVRDLTFTIGNSSFTKGNISPDPPSPPQNYGDEIRTTIPMMIIFIGVPGCVIGISTHQLNKTRKRRNAP